MATMVTRLKAGEVLRKIDTIQRELRSNANRFPLCPWHLDD